MRAGFKFRTTADGQRWLKMNLSGEGWPPDGWAIAYSDLETWGLLPWFATPPAQSEGMVGGREYEMSQTPQVYEFPQIIQSSFAELVKQTRPPALGDTLTNYDYSVELS